VPAVEQTTTKPVVEKTTKNNLKQSDPIVESVVAGALGENIETNSIDMHNFNVADQTQQQQTTKIPLVSPNTNTTAENILLLQHQLKLKQNQFQQQLQLDENLSNSQKHVVSPLNDFTSLQQTSSKVDPVLLAAAAAAAANPSNLLNKLTNQQQQQQQIAFDNLHTLQQQLTNAQILTNNTNMDPTRGAVGLDHPDADKWFYLDPQNQIQGAFSSEQMAGWFSAGYFSLSLMIRRGCDEKFVPLGVATNNWGRLPFNPGPQYSSLLLNQSQQLQQPQPQQPSQQQQQWTNEQIIQKQIQMFQRLQQQMQLQNYPQNINLQHQQQQQQQRNDLVGHNTNINGILQQLQQLQLQQQNATNLPLTQDLKSQQEALISQFLAMNTKQSTANTLISPNSMPDLDPAILGAAASGNVAPGGQLSSSNNNNNTNTASSASSIWGDMSNGSNRISPSNINSNTNNNNNNNINVLNTSPPIPLSISPINNLIQQTLNNNNKSQLNAQSFAQVAASLDNSNLNSNNNNLVQQIQALNSLNGNMNNIINNNNNSNSNLLSTLQMLNDSNIKDKIQSLFEQTKKEEERRRKQEEYQLKV